MKANDVICKVQDLQGTEGSGQLKQYTVNNFLRAK